MDKLINRDSFKLVDGIDPNELTARMSLNEQGATIIPVTCNWQSGSPYPLVIPSSSAAADAKFSTELRYQIDLTTKSALAIQLDILGLILTSSSPSTNQSVAALTLNDVEQTNLTLINVGAYASTSTLNEVFDFAETMTLFIDLATGYCVRRRLYRDENGKATYYSTFVQTTSIPNTLTKIGVNLTKLNSYGYATHGITAKVWAE